MSTSRIRTALALAALASCVVAAVALAGAFPTSLALHDSGDERVETSAHEVERATAGTPSTDAVRSTASVGADESTSGTVVAAQLSPPGSTLNVAIDYSPERPHVGENVTFDALDTGLSVQTIDAFHWDLDGDDDIESRGENATHAFEEAGTHTVELQVVYVNGTSVPLTETVSVQANQSPTAWFEYAPEEPLVGETVTLNASASSDPDGNVTNYRWTVDGDVVANGTNETATVAFDGHGNQTVSLRVTDDDGNENETTRTIDVQAAPTAQIGYEPGHPTVGENVTFDASNASDPDGTVENYTWTFFPTGSARSVEKSGETVTYRFQSAANYGVRLAVEDDDGNSNATNRTVLVESDEPPTAVFTYPSRPSVNESVTFDGSNSSDLFGAITNYTWTVDGSVVDDATDETLQYSFQRPGNYTVGLRVRDTADNVDWRNRSVEIVDPSPTAAFTSSPDAPLVGENVTLNASPSSDSDGTVSSYEWDAAGDADVVGSGPNVTVSFEDAGSATVTLTVTDDEGNTDDSTQSIEVTAGQPPTATFSYAPEQVLVGETATFDASASTDPEGNVSSYEWDLDGDGEAERYGENVTYSYDEAGDYEVTLLTSDDVGNENETTQTVRVAAPPAAAFDYDPDDPLTGENVTFDASAADDPDGSVANYTWSFFHPEDHRPVRRSGETVTYQFARAANYAVQLEVADDDGLVASNSTTVTVEAAPTAEFDYEPEVPLVDANVTLDASGASDPDGNVSSYEWDLNGDGEYESGNATTTARFGDHGNATVGLRVIDDDGNVDETNRTIRVEARPTAEFEYGPDDPLVSENVTFDASASTDPDGNVTSYDWDVDGDGEFELNGENATYSYDSPGKYNVTLQVTGGDERVQSTNRTLEVEAEPMAEFGYGPEDVVVDGTVTFNASASSDPDGNVTDYWWDIDGDGRFTDLRGEVVTYNFTSPGNHTVALRAVDGDGNGNSSNVTIFVESDEPPKALFDLEPREPLVHENVTFDASRASDPDGNVTSYEWDFGGDGFYDTDGSTVGHAFQTPGSHTIVLRVTDDDGNVDVLNRTIDVTRGPAPSPKFEHAPAEPLVGANVTFDASDTSDEDENVKQYEWNLYGDDEIDARGVNVTASYSDFGTRDVVLRVTDEAGNVVTETRSVDVQALPRPQFGYNPDPPEENTEVTFFASRTSDPDGTVDRYEWDFDGDGSYDHSGEVTEYYFDSVGNYNVSLRVIDDDGNTAALNKSVSVGADQPPTAAFDYSPNRPVVDENVTLDASSSSDTGGSVESYRWHFDTGQTVQSTAATIGHHFANEGRHTVVLVVTDDDGNTDTTVDTIQVDTDESPIARLETPERVVMNETATFDAGPSSDPDGTISDYEWNFGGDGAFQPGPEAANHTFEQAGNATVALRVTDDDGNVDVLNRTVVVDTDKPPVARYEYSPDSPRVGQTVTFDAANASDPDGNVTGYSWDIDGDGEYERSGENATYSYDNPDSYEVTLRISDDDGNVNETNRTVDVSAASGDSDDDDDYDPDPDPGGSSGGLIGIGGSGGPAASPSTSVELTRLAGSEVRVVVRHANAGDSATVQFDDFRAGDVTVDGLDVTPTYSGDELSFELRPAASAPDDVPVLDRVQSLGYLSVPTDPGAAFDGIDVRFDVPDSRLPDGATREDVRLYTYSDGEWTERETEEDAAGFSSSASDLSAMAIGVPAADVSVLDASVAPSSIAPGEPATVTANVTNEGSRAANRTIELLSGNSTVQSQTVQLQPNESRSVTFEPSFDSAGSYDLSIGDADAGTVAVSSGGGGGGSSSIAAIVGVVLAILAAVGVFVAERRFGL